MKRRKECRYGLPGVRIGVKGESGKVYVADGSFWDDRGNLRLDLIPEDCWEEHEAARPKGFITASELAAYRPPAHTRHGVPAEECLLLSDWPEVCPCWK